MGRIAKVFLFLIFVIALGFPRIAMKATDMMRSRAGKITELEGSLVNTKEELQASEENREALQKEVDAEKKKRLDAERNLEAARQQLNTVKAELKKKESDLNNSVLQKAALEKDVARLQEEKSLLETKLANLDDELGTLKKSATVTEFVEATDDGKEAGNHGKIVRISGGRFITVSMQTGIGQGAHPTFFVHRSGKVLGKATVQKIHGATVLIETADEEFLKQLGVGDRVELEGEQLVPSEFFEGMVAEVSSLGFVGIDLDAESKRNLQPAFQVYNNGDLIGKLNSERIISLFLIAELGGKARARIAQGDYLRMPR